MWLKCQQKMISQGKSIRFYNRIGKNIGIYNLAKKLVKLNHQMRKVN